MVDAHRYSFFGKKTGIILSSMSRSESFVMLTCIREKAGGSWEKPSQNEGKVVRISLEEMVEILRVLEQKAEGWSTVHKYKEESTKIEFRWKDDHHSALYIDIGSYPKMLNYSQTEVLRLLVMHLIKEKIVHATVPPKTSSESPDDPSNSSLEEKSTQKSKVAPKRSRKTQSISHSNHQPMEEEVGPIVQEVIQKESETDSMLIHGTFMAETPKAVLIGFESDKSVWFPKSTIRSPYAKEKSQVQQFLIDTWVLQKNQVVS
ncbi:MAG: hypothetical protein EU535_06340 [Promethearchaeota archaeon]|nr:MAG: hypothetical protein EU535_06340 [Candidatus Lokiarchaeota archaeon]